jgi:hypothetical protein
MLRAAGVSEQRMIGQLTFRQELALAGQLRHGHPEQQPLTACLA